MGNKQEIPLPLHVNKVKARGKYYYYYRPGRGSGETSKSIRISGEPTDPAWWDEYRRITNSPEPTVDENSFDSLIEAWQASPEWEALKPHTKEAYTRYCKVISDRWGSLQVRGLALKHVIRFRDDHAHEPAKANKMLRVLGSMIAWSVQRGYRKNADCCKAKPIKIKTDGYEPWTWEDVERAREELRPDLWHAAAIAVYTGQRLSDVISMRRNALRDGMISVKQHKTGKALEIPVHADLRVVLQSIRHNAMTFCANTRGVPWTESGFKTAWNKGKPQFLKDAGLVFHGLRKTAVVTLIEAGCTDAQVAAITGHSREMLVHYARGVNQAALARAAIRKWEGKQ